jgi:hypothetical protein
MFQIDRSVAIIKPKQPFVDWVNSVPDAGDDQYTVQDFSTDCSVILLPVVDSDEHAEAFIKDMFQDIFELELSSWVVVDDMWPENLTYKMFLEWFDVEYHSMAFDSLKDDIEKEPYDGGGPQNLDNVISSKSARIKRS